MKSVFQIYMILFTPFCLNGQYFLELHSEADNSFREWDIVLELDSLEIEGELRLTWGMENDWTEWQYRVGDLDGEIVQKYRNNPRLWELRSEDKIVTMQQVWPGDPTEWYISCDKRKFTFRSVSTYHLDEWKLVQQELGELVLITEIQGDPRDWIISDYMLDNITFEERMASIFIGLYVSIPKY